MNEQLNSLKTAWTHLHSLLSDDQGCIVDEKSAECVACCKKARTIDEINHDPDCLTQAVGEMYKAMEAVVKE